MLTRFSTMAFDSFRGHHLFSGMREKGMGGGGFVRARLQTLPPLGVAPVTGDPNGPTGVGGVAGLSLSAKKKASQRQQKRTFTRTLSASWS